MKYTNIIAGLVGIAIGVLGSRTYYKKTYEKLCSEEIERVRNIHRKRTERKMSEEKLYEHEDIDTMNKIYANMVDDYKDNVTAEPVIQRIERIDNFIFRPDDKGNCMVKCLAPEYSMSDYHKACCTYTEKFKFTGEYKPHAMKKPIDYSGIPGPQEETVDDFIGVMDEFNEENQRNDISLISHEEFMLEQEAFDKLEYHYYTVDDKLTDEDDYELPDYVNHVGVDWKNGFGIGSKNPDICYVRNWLLGSDYEIRRIYASCYDPNYVPPDDVSDIPMRG